MRLHLIAACVLLTVVSVSGQARWTPSRTAWGDPDLQGIWSYNDDVNTPFERPGELAGKPVVGDEELAELLEDRARRNVERAPTIGGETGAGPGALVRVLEREVRSHVARDRSAGRQGPGIDACGPETPGGARRSEAWTRSGRLLGGSQPGRSLHRLARRLASCDRESGQLRQHHPDPPEPGYVVIVHEMIHETRVIPVDGRPHIPQGLRQYLGDPRGRWDGDTLVVDVTNFSNKTDFRGSRETLHLTERFTRLDADTITYQVTIDDPATFTRPWTLGVPFKQDKEQAQLFDTACHEGNYAMRNILSGARADERAR